MKHSAARSLATASTIVLGLSALGLGCGGDQPKPEREPPQVVAQRYLEALSNRDAVEACRLATFDEQRVTMALPVMENGVLVGYENGCDEPRDYQFSAPDLVRRTAVDLDDDSFEETGETASGGATTEDGDEFIIELVLEDDQWKVEADDELISQLDRLAVFQANVLAVNLELRRIRTGSHRASAREVIESESKLRNAALTNFYAEDVLYRFGVTSRSGTLFSLTMTVKLGGGSRSVSFTCTRRGTGGCPSSGTWATRELEELLRDSNPSEPRTPRPLENPPYVS